MKKTWFGIISLSFMMLCCSPAFAEVNSVPSIIWTVQKGILYIDVQGVDFYNIDDFAWKGRVITDQVNNGIQYGTILLQEYTNGFRLTIKESDTSLEEPGEFSLMLKSGEEVNIDMLASPIFSEKMCAPQSKALSSSAVAKSSSASKCGNFTDSANPYPCCSNGSRPDGNCTWYAWYRAHQTYRGWGKSLPKWGNAKDWAKNAANSSAFRISSKPRGYKDGYSIGCNTSGTYGHVAWVYDYDDRYVWVDEMNCCDCSVAGYRQSAKYKRSYFTSYIYKR